MQPLGLRLGLNLAARHRIVVTSAALGTGVALCARRVTHCSSGVCPAAKEDKPSLAPKFHSAFVDAVAGALGEVAQILVLYPLDTVKVRCQASGDTAAVVVKRLLRRGFNLQLVRKLYAGALGAAACAVLVGAVHFASYEGARKALLKLLSPRAASADCSSNACSPSTACSPSASPGAAAIAEHDSGGGGDAQFGRAAATFGAAALAAVATALVESPVELFRHNAQAGLVQSNFMREMAATVRREGVGGLYWGFLPHCFEAWPHDISELATYGFMREFQDGAQRPGSRHSDWASGLSHEAWDLATGAASGAAAVLVSMPFDTVKTYLQTHGGDLSGRGLLGSAALFAKSGRKIVARKGLAGLYVGVTPRLLQQVPSAMVCWGAIAAFKRAMEPYTLPEEEWPAPAPASAGAEIRGGSGGSSGH